MRRSIIRLKPSGQLRKPYISQHQHSPLSQSPAKKKLTPINILLHHHLLRALIHIRHTLQRIPGLRTIKNTRRIEDPPQRIALPPKHIVGMIRIAGCVAEAPDEWIGAVGGPGEVVEGLGVPDYFVH